MSVPEVSKMNRSVNQPSIKRKENLFFMDDFCKKQKIFTNKDEQFKHKINCSRKLYHVFEKTLNTAFKHCQDLPEVPGMWDFLQPIPRVEDQYEQEKANLKAQKKAAYDKLQ